MPFDYHMWRLGCFLTATYSASVEFFDKTLLAVKPHDNRGFITLVLKLVKNHDLSIYVGDMELVSICGRIIGTKRGTNEDNQ